MTSAFTITPTPPTTLTLEPGQEGKFSFTLTSLEAPDQVQEVILQALLIGPEDKGKEVDWLVAGPTRALSMAGNKTETVTITARPTPTSPRGENRIKLAIADKDHPNDTFVYSAPVTCAVVDKLGPITPQKKKLPKWLIPANVGGVLVLGGGAFALSKLLSSSSKAPGLGEACEPGSEPCGDKLICSADAKKCLQPGGGACKDAGECDSSECVTTLGVCATRIGLACDPVAVDSVPCPREGHCDATAKTCVKNACKPGDKQCTADGHSVSSCQDDGTFKTEPCPANASVCRDGKCACAPNLGQTCNCGGTIQCDGSCSKQACKSSCINGQCCDLKAGGTCGTCGGIVQCDGTCSKPTPLNLGQSCGHCGGKSQCDGTCSRKDPDNFGRACGECGGIVECDGKCSKPLHRCPAGFVVADHGKCRSRDEIEIRHEVVPIPAACPLNQEPAISIPCGGSDRIRTSHSIKNTAGGLARCDGTFASPNTSDCSVRIHLVQPPVPAFPAGLCRPGKCDVTVWGVALRPECTN